MAGFNPAEVEFRTVVDLTWALLMEVYREYGMKFEEASTELRKQLGEETTPAVVQQKRTQDDASSMAILQAMMKDSDFSGPRG